MLTLTCQSKFEIEHSGNPGECYHKLTCGPLNDSPSDAYPVAAAARGGPDDFCAGARVGRPPGMRESLDTLI